MHRPVACVILFAHLLFLSIGCGEEIEHQIEFRGIWTLEVRQLADGRKLVPPEIGGLLEWYPTDITRAHVTIAFSTGEKSIQLTESAYALNEQTFTQEEYIRIGGDHSLPPQPVSETPHSTTEGRITVDDDRIVFTHANGTTYTFEGDTLTVTHHSGTIDFWKLSKDEKGLLAK